MTTLSLKKIKLKLVLINLFLIIAMFFLLKNPTENMQSISNGLNLWLINIVPSLFPFIFLTKLYSNFDENSNGKISKIYSKIFRMPRESFKIFFMSIVSGYPIGAKLVSDYYDNKLLSDKETTKVSILCSTSGPLFVIGTVGVSLFLSVKAGIIIFISHIIGTIINSFIYSNKTDKRDNQNSFIIRKKPENILSSSMVDSITSILVVGGFVAISSLLIDIFSTLKIYSVLVDGLNILIGNKEVSSSIINGIFEITRGCKDLSCLTIPLSTKTNIASFLISFGGLSILMQSFSFLEKSKVNKKKYIFAKFTQGMISFVVSTIITKLVF